MNLRPLRTLQVGDIDSLGTRFNGQDLHKHLLERGIESRHAVWTKTFDDADTFEFARFPGRHQLNNTINRLEKGLSIQSLLHPFAFLLPQRRYFREADIVHYHLIHNGYFSLSSLPLLSTMRPTVWTLHDPWAMTGHCVYPFDCQKWRTGCGHCPYLDTHFAMARDHTAFMWQAKKLFYSFSRVDVIVASKWMLNMAKASPLMSKFNLHHIPFGIDLDVFQPGSSELKKRLLGVIPGNTVLCLRAVDSQFKGLNHVLDALARLQTQKPLTILTFNDKGRFDKYLGKYQVIDLGWVDDLELTIDAYQATDIFLMPSTAEAFGMMAIEAMACGKPCIIFDSESTSLPEVTFAPDGAVAVPMKDSSALANAISDLVDDRAKREKIGQRARSLALRHYDVKLHVDRIINLYHEIASRKRADSVSVSTATKTSPLEKTLVR